MILLGVTHTDTETDAKYIADKTANLRIFEDENGKLNLIAQRCRRLDIIGFPITLYADARSGAVRPSPMLPLPNKRINFINTLHNFYANMD